MINNPYKPFAAKITGITEETNCEFTITVAAAVAITPGQFFQVSLPKIGEAPISVSNYGQNWIQFTVRAVGRLTNALQGLKTGDNLFIRGPYGVGFPVEKLRDSNLIIVAGGSGVAPVKPLIHQSIDGRLPVRSLRLILGFKSAAGILFAEEIRQWQNKCDMIVSVDKPESGWVGPTGLVTEHIRKMKLVAADDVQVVVVGPPVMMKFSTAELRLLGVPDVNIWVSFERLMSCGLGKCGHCKIDSTYVCVDGPVMNYSHASTLID